MGDARAAARAWLAEVHLAADCPHAYNPCADCLADAILNTPGVDVQIAWAPYGRDAGTGRLAIMLPIAAKSADGGRE